MASPHRLDTPPPASHFRRPWSPQPFDPNPSHHGEPFQYQDRGLEQRREPTDVSVEALDLAEYARTLAHHGDSRYAPTFQPVFNAYDSYPPSPQPLRPLASRDSFSPPPILSPASTTSHSSYSSAAPLHRPFSMPMPASPHRGTLQSYLSHAGHSSRPGHDDPLLTPPDEIDIGQFPKFARGWYRNPRADYFDPPQRELGPPEVDIFDPSYPTEQKSFPSLPPSYASPYSQASRSSRDLVPWDSDPAETANVDPDIKAERMRMLEREFGKEAKGEVDEEHFVGSVNARGRLITEGPKKRLTTRWMQVLLALLAAGSGIYGAAFIKPASAPPPANKPPAYVLYVLSVLTFVFVMYFFLIHPSCAAKRSRKASTPFTEGPGGMMVLPVPNMPGGKPQRGRKGKNKHGRGGEGVQVNLIVDPAMLGGNRHEEDESVDEDSDSEYTIPGTYSGRSRGRRRPHGKKRRGVFAGLALEAQWRHARGLLKWGMTADVALFFIWGAEFIYILLGKRCPSGGFEGWCDAYNVASAAACLLCVAFGISTFFDVKDLHASKASPRTRT